MSARRLNTASVVGLVAQVLSIGLALWSTPRIVHGLGASGFALFSVVGTFVSYFAWLELGLGAAFMRALTLSLASRSFERAQVQVGTAQFFYSRIALSGAGLLLLLGLPYIFAVETEPETRAHGAASMVLLGLAFAISMYLSAARAVVFSMQRVDLYSRATLIVSPLVPLIQVFVVVQGGGMFGVFAVQATANVLVDLYLLYCARRLVPELVYRGAFDAATWAEWRSFSLQKFGSQVAAQAQLNADRLLLSFLFPLPAITPYAVSSSISTRVRGLGNALLNPFFPAAAERFANTGAPGVAALLAEFGGRITATLSIGVAGATLVSAPFLEVWMGPELARSSGSVLVILIGASAVGVVLSMLTLAMEAMGDAGSAFRTTLVTLVLSVGIGAALGLSIGIEGTAWGFLIGPSLGFGMALAQAGERLRFGFLWRFAAVPALMGIATAAAAWGVVAMLPPASSALETLVQRSAIGGVACLPALALIVRGTIWRPQAPKVAAST